MTTLTIHQVESIQTLLQSQNMKLLSTNRLGTFNNSSSAARSKLGYYSVQIMNTFSSLFSSSYLAGGGLCKQRIVTFSSFRRLFSLGIFESGRSYFKRVIEEIKARGYQFDNKRLRELMLHCLQVFQNTYYNRQGFQIRDDQLIIYDGFRYKKFSNCDREYEVGGLGPVSSETRDFILRMMNVDATDIDQKSSTPTIFLQLLDRAVLRAEMDDRHDDLAELERGRVHLQNALKRKESGEAGVKEMLNATLNGCREYLNDIDMNGIHTMLRTYVRTEGGFNTFGKPAKSWLSHQNMNVEHKLQRTFEKHLSDIGIKTLSHIYDGCIVYGHPTEEQIKVAEKMTIEEVGVNMTWVIKKVWSKK